MKEDSSADDEAEPSIETPETSSTISSSCECQCCSNVSTPHHPLEVDDSKEVSSTVVNGLIKNLIQELFKAFGTKFILDQCVQVKV